MDTQNPKRNSGLSKRTEELLEEYGDLAGVVPYAGEVLAAYRIVRVRRMQGFLRGLADSTAELSDSERERFQAYMASPAGRELLADFAEATLRARTRTATAAIAILYADHDNKHFTVDFKGEVLPALEQLTDRAIDALLLLVSHRGDLSKAPGEGPYDVYALRGSTLQRYPDMGTWSREGRDWVALIGDLIARRLLDPDWAAGSRLGDEDWATYFAVSEFTVATSRLLDRARGYLALNASST